MRLKLTEKQKTLVEQAAVKDVVQKRLEQLIAARAEEINQELLLLDTELSTDDIVDKYLQNPSAGLAIPAPGILVPKH